VARTKSKSEEGMAWAGIFGWQLALAILPASAWLIICRLIPGLRRGVGVSYCVAAVLVVLSCLLSRFGLTLCGLAAGAIAAVGLGIRWRRALMQRSLEINTIINYHNSDGL